MFSGFSLKVFNFFPLLIAQIICHLSIIPMLIWAEVSHYFIALLVYFFTGCIGMSMTYHRLIAHRSWQAPRWLEIFGTLCATIGLTGSSLAWCSVHREHHEKPDTKTDPHSPKFKKWWHIQFFSMLYQPKIRLIRDKLKDPFHSFVHRNYFYINIFYGLGVCFLDPFALVYAYLFPATILWNCGSAVNTIGHLWGYKNFKSENNSRNNPLLALITWGEGWHNNHHWKPKKFYFGVKWYEVDVTGTLIYLLYSLKRKPCNIKNKL